MIRNPFQFYPIAETKTRSPFQFYRTPFQEDDTQPDLPTVLAAEQR